MSPENEPITQILLIRHGQTESNIAGRIQGQSDSKLTERGRFQIEAAAKRLKQYSTFGSLSLLTSPLGRAVQSANIIGNAIGQQPKVLEDLREISFGKIEGKTWSEVEESQKELSRSWFRHDADVCFEGGETREAAVERVLTALQNLPHLGPDHKYVVVTHGGVLAALFAKVLQIPFGVRPQCMIPNAAFYSLSSKLGSFRIASWADSAHLELL